MLRWGWLLLCYQQCSLIFKLPWNIFVLFRRPIWKSLVFLLFMHCKPCSTKLFVIQPSDWYVTYCKTLFEAVAWQADWRSFQASFCWFFLHSPQNQFQLDGLSSERTILDVSAEFVKFNQQLKGVEQKPGVASETNEKTFKERTIFKIGENKH